MEVIEHMEEDMRLELIEELQKSKIKLTEVENENAKVNFVIQGLSEKVTNL